jgi:hypothetical protein
MKAIQKMIVMSATYRQSSDAAPEWIERDPRNQLLARGPRTRLPAETVRDQMLAVSGLLSDKMYGEPVMPLQPDNVWQVVYNGDRWETSAGEDRYRRALYTMARRTSPYPAMVTFDAPSGEVCTMRRVPTNTPLQALVTLNDPIALEAAQHLAARALENTDGDAGKTIERAYKLTLARAPTEAEAARLRKLYEQARSDLMSDPVSARQLIHVDRLIYERDRKRTLLPTSREAAQMWRSTTSEPPAGWQQPAFDASAWSESPGFFARLPKDKKEDEGDEDRRRIRTNWDSERLWLRREFELDGTPLEKAQLLLEYRGNFEIWINGVEAAASGDDISGREEIEITGEALKTLHPGTNVIAIAVRRTIKGDGDQYMDAGLAAVSKADLGAERSDDPEHAAWVMVAHVLLNLDETLTKR